MFQLGKYETAAATFADYDPRAPQIAQLLKQALEQREPKLVVEHIGSTAVPAVAEKASSILPRPTPTALSNLPRLPSMRSASKSNPAASRSQRHGQCE
jgi:hypothetical protein